MDAISSAAHERNQPQLTQTRHEEIKPQSVDDEPYEAWIDMQYDRSITKVDVHDLTAYHLLLRQASQIVFPLPPYLMHLHF